MATTTARRAAAALGALALLAAPGLPAAAAAPAPVAGDARTAPVELAVPGAFAGDAGAATADPGDPVPGCSDRLAATTWHAFTASATGQVLVEVTTPGWEPTVAAFPVGADGRPGAGTWCSLGGAVPLDVVAGQRYLLAVGATGGAVPGAYRVALGDAPAAPEVSLTVDPAAVLRSGRVVVGGTYRCTGALDPRAGQVVVEFSGGTLRQGGRPAGTFALDGTLALCDGEAHPWAARTGRTSAVPGRAVVALAATVCTGAGCGEGSVRGATRIARARG
ncbi:DUF6299 family protein [Vallicoccus soli]|uniref:DUF6299 domain-containing protein n=1 Tax=Vallicoccus soli TaxID=2339232 RepID=A0A3A3ZMM7_9ACTN|nr:DUF6299 family protein [Vallicoccus soli]RJK97921.1 hypothetical protein D5H78_02850 [Vallicoccus soli]